MSDRSTQRYAVASMEGPSRTGISDEGRSEVRAGLALRAANEFQNGNKVKQLRPGPPGTSFEEPPQARLVKIAHGRLAAWLDPFGMLPSQVVVNLSLKLGHGVGRVTD